MSAGDLFDDVECQAQGFFDPANKCSAGVAAAGPDTGDAALDRVQLLAAVTGTTGSRPWESVAFAAVDLLSAS
jgi:hypothetical protein